MGDHPVIWTNPHVKARNVYVFMGHSPILFDDTVYTRIVRNAIFWASATAAPATRLTPATPAPALAPRFKALAFYTTTVEPDHVDFANDAIRFYSRLAAGKGNFILDTTSDWSNMNPAKLKQYQLVLWLNDFPQNAAQRTAFEQYIEGGGAWLGFHVSAYNDSYTHWPWFVQFLGGAVFKDNSWPPLTARLLVDDTLHPVTLGLPGKYTGPVNEWYRWSPDPRANKDIKVLVTLDPRQYPLGKKDRIRSGDVPVVWTNTHYKMLYMNMGHGDQIFRSAVQNQLCSKTPSSGSAAALQMPSRIHNGPARRSPPCHSRAPPATSPLPPPPHKTILSELSQAPPTPPHPKPPPPKLPNHNHTTKKPTPHPKKQPPPPPPPNPNPNQNNPPPPPP